MSNHSEKPITLKEIAIRLLIGTVIGVIFAGTMLALALGKI
jgi:hypothetical protein